MDRLAGQASRHGSIAGVRGGRVADLVAGYGHVVVDECHHVPAVSFERILSEVRARYLVGLTGPFGRVAVRFVAAFCEPHRFPGPLRRPGVS